MISAISLLNKITRPFGLHLRVEHEIQRMDFQRDFRTWSNVFRVESRLVVTRYGSVRNYRGDGARFRDGIMKEDRLR